MSPFIFACESVHHVFFFDVGLPTTISLRKGWLQSSKRSKRSFTPFKKMVSCRPGISESTPSTCFFFSEEISLVVGVQTTIILGNLLCKSLTWMFRPFWGSDSLTFHHHLGWPFTGVKKVVINCVDYNTHGSRFRDDSNPISTHTLGCEIRNLATIRFDRSVAKSEGFINGIPTVDGRNPKQPPGMYKTLWIMGYLLYQLVQDFFHQQ